MTETCIPVAWRCPICGKLTPNTATGTRYHCLGRDGHSHPRAEGEPLYRSNDAVTEALEQLSGEHETSQKYIRLFCGAPCPDGKVCEDCVCASDDDVCFPHERLIAELQAARNETVPPLKFYADALRSLDDEIVRLEKELQGLGKFTAEIIDMLPPHLKADVKAMMAKEEARKRGLDSAA